MSHDDDLLKAKNANAAKKALDAGADPNAVDKDGVPALHHAVRKKTLELAELLASRGADLNIRDRDDSYTALHILCKSKSGVMSKTEVAAALWLIEHGADVNALSDFQDTPLHFAARSGSHEVLEALLAKGAKPTRTRLGHTPLHFCFGTHDKDTWVWEKLLANGCGLEDTNESQETALLNAQSSWNDFAVKWLLARGADRNARGYNGKTALESAEELKQEKIVKLLK
jgi:ankyrin repeat protein